MYVKNYTHMSTVNGDIWIHWNSPIMDLQTVNGSIYSLLGFQEELNMTTEGGQIEVGVRQDDEARTRRTRYNPQAPPLYGRLNSSNVRGNSK